MRLVSRNKKAFDFPQLLDALKKLPAQRIILDGEIATLDEKGRSSFQLGPIIQKLRGVPLVYYAFDLLFSEGKDLRLADLRSPSGDPASSKTAIQKLKYLPHLELLECHGTNARNRRSTPLNYRLYQIWSVQQYPVRKR